MQGRNPSAGPLLRSAPLREFNALGSVGRPVFSSAAQLRASIRRQLGDDVADMLAVPQINEAGETVDWYAPKGGLVVPWSAATESEREALREPLQAARLRLLAHAESLAAKLKAQPEGEGDLEVYARMLPLVMQVPDDGHIYSVDGKPVLSFWGFTRLNAPVSADVIRDLTAAAAAAPIPAAAPAAAAVAAKAANPWRWAWLALSLLLLLLLLSLFGLRSCGVDVPFLDRTTLPGAPEAEKKVEPVQPGVVTGPTVVVPGTGVVAVPGGTAGGEGGSAVVGVPDATGTNGAAAPDAAGANGVKPPEANADAAKQPDAANPTAPKPPEAKPDAANPTAPKPPEAKDGATAPNPPLPQRDEGPKQPLVIPPEATKSGATDFLNGKWTSRSGLMDATTGLPATVEYDFQNGKGTTTIRRADGTVCKGDSTATMNNGRLVIQGTGDPKCSDGSAYGRARVECAPDKNGRAVCTGKPQQGPAYSVDIGR